PSAFVSMCPSLLIPSLFPYTTLFRSPTLDVASLGWSEKGSPKFMVEQAVVLALQQNPDVRRALEEIKRTKGVIIQIRAEALPQRSEEHTSELQSPHHLVCRLRLEKKN